MYDVITKADFSNDLFPHVFAQTGVKNVNVHKLAVVFMVLSLGALFDLNSPPCKFWFELALFLFACLIFGGGGAFRLSQSTSTKVL